MGDFRAIVFESFHSFRAEYCKNLALLCRERNSKFILNHRFFTFLYAFVVFFAQFFRLLFYILTRCLKLAQVF